MPAEPVDQSIVSPVPRHRYFTLEEANQSLVYVGPVVEDIHRSYRRAVELQSRLESDPDSAHDIPLHAEYDCELKKLQSYVDELQMVGVELKDFDLGLIDFPAMHEGRQVCLCWKRGEKRIMAWHEADAGFAGRKDVALLEKQKV